MMQTILGSGGAVGIELAKALTKYTSDIRLVSRHPRKVNESDKLITADLCVKEDVEKAVEGSDICYLTAGLEYNVKVWREKWPVIMTNVVDACIKYKTKLVFFDNVYAIGGDNVKHITEDSPVSPTSEKGRIRASVESIILKNIESGKLSAIIARAPDFFSSVKASSIVMNMVYDNLIKGSKAQWFCRDDAVHSIGYVPDLAAGTALLGNTPDAYNQVWNLPVDGEALTGKQWVELFASELNTEPKLKIISPFSLKAIGIFMPVLREMVEMLYQYDRDYYFDSGKFVKKFNYKPKSNKEAVKETIGILRMNN